MSPTKHKEVVRIGRDANGHSLYLPDTVTHSRVGADGITYLMSGQAGKSEEVVAHIEPATGAIVPGLPQKNSPSKLAPPTAPAEAPRALKLVEAAQYAGLSTTGFRQAVKARKYPKATLPGRRYDRVLLEKAMNRMSNVNQSESPLDNWRDGRGARSA